MEKQCDVFLKRSLTVITGASRGIGRCIALRFGAKFPLNSAIVLMARDMEALENVRKDLIVLSSTLQVFIKQYDQGKVDTGSFHGVFDSILTENKLSSDDFDQTILVHNCASIGVRDKTALQLSNANDVRSYFDINLVGMILLNTSFFTTFSNPVKSRIIINISSEGSQHPSPSLHLYCSGKAARDMFFQVLAQEEPSIRILTYAPGIVDTEMLRDVEVYSSSPAFRKVLFDLRRDNKLWTPEEAVTDLVKVLEDNTFENAVYVDNYQQIAKQYIDEMLSSK